MSDQEYMVDLGRKLFVERTALGLSQADLAGVLDVSSSSISNWEKGTAVIGAPTLARMKAYFRQQRKAKGMAEVTA